MFDQNDKPQVQEIQFGLNVACEELGLDEETVKMLLDEFATTAKEDLELLNEAILNDDANKVAYYAHSIKGAAGNLRVDPMFAISREIETNAKTNYNSEKAKSDYQKLNLAYNVFLKWLATI